MSGDIEDLAVMGKAVNVVKAVPSVSVRRPAAKRDKGGGGGGGSIASSGETRKEKKMEGKSSSNAMAVPVGVTLLIVVLVGLLLVLRGQLFPVIPVAPPPTMR